MIRRMWVNRFFQTPSSTSCIRSTVRRGNTSMSGRQVMNEFWRVYPSASYIDSEMTEAYGHRQTRFVFNQLVHRCAGYNVPLIENPSPSLSDVTEQPAGALPLVSPQDGIRCFSQPPNLCYCNVTPWAGMCTHVLDASDGSPSIARCTGHCMSRVQLNLKLLLTSLGNQRCS